MIRGVDSETRAGFYRFGQFSMLSPFVCGYARWRTAVTAVCASAEVRLHDARQVDGCPKSTVTVMLADKANSEMFEGSATRKSSGSGRSALTLSNQYGLAISAPSGRGRKQRDDLLGEFRIGLVLPELVL